MTFADNLQQLPAITHLAALHLLDATGTVVATIENKPGKSGARTQRTWKSMTISPGLRVT